VLGLHGFILNANALHLTTNGSNPTLPLRMSANPCKDSGFPYGLVAVNGMVHTSMPEGLPSLIVYKDGGVEIRSDFNVKNVAEARFVISGSKLLIENKKRVNVDSPVYTKDSKAIPRLGVGVLGNGRLLFIYNECTTEELQTVFYTHRCIDAMMTACDDVFIDYPIGGLRMGSLPITVLEAMDFKELPRPIVLIDPGHGGLDPGAVGFDLKEKDLNLRGSRIIYEYLVENFEGTFLLTRDTDKTLPLKDRPKMANAIGADFFLSLHVNASDNRGTGFETFTYPADKEVNKVEQQIQRDTHNEVMTFLASHGFVDRGVKQANFCVLRETNCPALLIEQLFIDMPKDNAFLSDPILFKNLYLITAKAYARALGLQPKVTADDIAPDGELYRVQVGAYRFKKNAEVMLERLTRAGFDGYIKRE
jgi:N-acetylmuramoyl-L-alanine amidase